jgi:hypothetical protein
MAVTTMVAENDVAILKVMKHTNGIGLLSQVGMGSAGEYARGKFIQHRLFEAADAVKLAVESLI